MTSNNDVPCINNQNRPPPHLFAAITPQAVANQLFERIPCFRAMRRGESCDSEVPPAPVPVREPAMELTDCGRSGGAKRRGSSQISVGRSHLISVTSMCVSGACVKSDLGEEESVCERVRERVKESVHV